MQVPEHLRNYIDYEAYGRDIALEESGQFTDLGYVRDTGDSFHEYYDGEHGSIPEEYRVMAYPASEILREESKVQPEAAAPAKVPAALSPHSLKRPEQRRAHERDHRPAGNRHTGAFRE